MTIHSHPQIFLRAFCAKTPDASGLATPPFASQHSASLFHNRVPQPPPSQHTTHANSQSLHNLPTPVPPSSPIFHTSAKNFTAHPPQLQPFPDISVSLLLNLCPIYPSPALPCKKPRRSFPTQNATISTISTVSPSPDSVKRLLLPQPSPRRRVTTPVANRQARRPAWFVFSSSVL